jgi:diphosphomevalonate decarboxylase
MQEHIKAKDVVKTGFLAELDCIDMHKSMWTSNPPIKYWTDTTHKVIDAVLELQNHKIPCFYTIDAGPNVKIICLESDVEKIKNHLQSLTNVKNIFICKVAADPVVNVVE